MPTTRTHLRGWSWLAVLVGGALFVTGAAGWVGDELGLVLSYRWMDHPFGFGTTGLAVLTVAAAILVPRPVVGLVVLVIGAVVTTAWAAKAFERDVFASSDVNDDLSYVVNDDGSLRTMVVDVGFLDIRWEIRVEQRGRLLNHWHTVGCVDGDGVRDLGLRWSGDDLVVTSSQGGATIEVDGNGRGGAIHLDEQSRERAVPLVQPC
ncbi:hypothetical protein ASE01_09930 [Nocardioides sp. Root190]|uniref:hypothetical protein n=1 Tax=Nocardioides sp. Root190 TaxID=1736488 RepID=UPI0006F651BD|nr:hypothetical protein [Nocardioides sp. Root190]KRB77068.1 hypothetical protein ASE01_09930 [Nocardioides sp. Root190]